jgi:hypothetical protein
MVISSYDNTLENCWDALFIDFSGTHLWTWPLMELIKKVLCKAGAIWSEGA